MKQFILTIFSTFQTLTEVCGEDLQRWVALSWKSKIQYGDSSNKLFFNLLSYKQVTCISDYLIKIETHIGRQSMHL